MLTQIRFWGKLAANIVGINPKGLKNSLEKALTYAHIKIRQGAPCRDYGWFY
jgi:hypothetical protein